MSTKRILSDFHHAGLLHSLQLLFEGRFGWELYRPIGREWHSEGYWKIYDHPATVAQYLDVGGATPDGSARLNQTMQIRDFGTLSDEVFLCTDISSEKINKAITFEGFMKRSFDVVIASIPKHIAPFRELCDRHPDKPLLIYQIGNAWNLTDDDAQKVDAIMSSALVQIPESIPHVFYHQEFPLDIFAKIEPWYGSNQIASFVNVFTKENALFKEDVELFERVEKLLPEYSFKIYGGQGRDGVLQGDRAVAREMSRSLFIWHTKKDGDGYGHIIHNAFAMTRPLLIKADYYKGKFAERLMRRDTNCVVIDDLSAEDIARKIRQFSLPDNYQAIHQSLNDGIDFSATFDSEASAIKTMIEKLLDIR